MEKTSGEVSMSLIALKAGIEGPIIKNKLSYHLSFRRTFLDVWVKELAGFIAVSYTHLRAHETVLDLVCRLLLETKKTNKTKKKKKRHMKCSTNE